MTTSETQGPGTHKYIKKPAGSKPGNVDNRNPRNPVPELAKRLVGKLFGDKGYISAELFDQLWRHGLQLVTQIRQKHAQQADALVG